MKSKCLNPFLTSIRLWRKYVWNNIQRQLLLRLCWNWNFRSPCNDGLLSLQRLRILVCIPHYCSHSLATGKYQSSQGGREYMHLQQDWAYIPKILSKVWRTPDGRSPGNGASGCLPSSIEGFPLWTNSSCTLWN